MKTLHWNAIPYLWNDIPMTSTWNTIPFRPQGAMVEAKRKVPRREAALSRAQIVSMAIDILDRDGEAGLTFKALAAALATGAGAIYGHIASKSDLMAAAADTIIAGVQHDRADSIHPRDSIKAFASGMFDAIDTHSWIGAALTRMPGELPSIRILDAVGQDVRALGVRQDREWSSSMAIFNYIVGVGSNHAANAQLARIQRLDRGEMLTSLARNWSHLDLADYPFVQSVGPQLRAHDDRADFLTGIDFIITGIIAAATHRGSIDTSRNSA